MPPFDHRSGTVLPIADADLYVEQRGPADGPVIVLLHGGLKDLEDFNYVLPFMPGACRLIAIDSRGQGRSTLGSAELTYRRMEEDVAAVLAQIDVTSCAVMGFSDGGIVGYRLAMRSAPAVEALITVGSRWRYDVDDPTRPELAATSPATWRKQFPDAFARYEALNAAPDAAALTKALIGMWFDESEAGHPRDRVASIESPLLIARGDDDHLTTAVSMLALQRRVGGAHFLNVPFAEHAAFEAQPQLFMLAANRVLDAWRARRA
jgi:pimeloyl-ACP methyl ester carboxylesterase